MKKILAILCGIFMTVCIARESYPLAMGPDKFEVRLPAGGKFVADYYAQNDTDEPLSIKVGAENWYPDAYNYSNLKIEDWIRLDPTEFNLAPKEIKKVKLYIDVPKDITGEVTAQIFFSSELKESVMSGKGTVTAKLGGVLYLAIKGTEKVDAGIIRIKVSNAKEDGKEKLKIEATLKNNGNVHLRPTGAAVIMNEKGEKITNVDLMTGYSVLPNNEHVFCAFLEKTVLKAGKYRISVMMDYGKLYEIEKVASLEQELDVNDNGEVLLK